MLDLVDELRLPKGLRDTMDLGVSRKQETLEDTPEFTTYNVPQSICLEDMIPRTAGTQSRMISP